MAKLGREQIRDRAIEMIKASKDGVRHGELVKFFLTQHKETPAGTVHAAIGGLGVARSQQVFRPVRGLYKTREAIVPPVDAPAETTLPGRESEKRFYEPFAEFLRNDLEECTAARALGGAMMRTKWGTPDVVGVYRSLKRDLIPFPMEIVVAEVKTDPNQPVIAFGQAVAYRLFASKIYLVLPSTSDREDQDRIEALCMLQGIGLILFNAADPQQPDFDIRMRAQRFSPDMFFVNQFAERLKEADPAAFDELFG